VGQEPLVLAVRYQSQKLGVTRTALRFQPAGAPFARYYDTSGTELEERLIDSPLDEYEQVTSLLRDGRGHKGVDFKVPVGTDVHAPVDGVVTRRNWKFRSNGNCLAIEDQASHRELLFLHLSETAPGIRPGSHVKKGEVIAKTGNTGHTTAPHLHYQMMSPDQRVLDPFAVQETTRRKLSVSDMPAFQKAVAALGPGPELHVER
jgi:murein DD-endopeptidase MepM/ murein hydrolase activator NlpD